MAERMGFAVGVFEEGYLRPDHVTFEPIGVNGHSQFHQDLAEWLQQQALQDHQEALQQLDAEAGFLPSALSLGKGDLPKQPEAPKLPQHHSVGNTYWHAAAWGMLYFFAAWLGQFFWNNTLHHRRMSVFDAPWWWLSFGRKAWYRVKERNVQALLEGQKRHKFFLVPLQVHNDAQITVHSGYESVCGFIDHVMRSFAGALLRECQPDKQLPPGSESVQGDMLVFKHHPMDRGHRNYGKAVRLLAQRHGLQGRVLYIHDQHLPSLLKACKGVVLVNSTTGLSALGHGAPVKVCGSALYDLPRITFQGRLNDFWFQARSAVPDAEVLRRFKAALIKRTQLNGSFYRKLPQVRWRCGVALQGQMALRLWPKPKAAAPVRQPVAQANKRKPRRARGKARGAVGKAPAL
ncbi:capsular biosynthesis protein [Pantoea sp. 18069]|uniref:capsular biosynthesis protein n=1 Tax=Pantoea sp. 18069 TaxID=2681415 RepID=UPI0034D4C630